MKKGLRVASLALFCAISSLSLVSAGSLPTSNSEINSISEASNFRKTSLPPSITLQPLMPNACADGGFALSVYSSDTDTYQWQLSTNGGSTWSDITDIQNYNGVTTSTLHILSNADLEGDQLRCVLTNSFGTTNSSAVTVAYSSDCETILVDQWNNIDASGSSAVVAFDATDSVLITAPIGGEVALIYKKTPEGEWLIDQTLTLPNNPTGLGWDIALAGNFFFVGVSNGNGSPGAVYVFEFSSGSWGYLQTISAPNGEDHFSNSIQVDGDYLLVSGEYIYKLVSGFWTYQTQLSYTKISNPAYGFIGTIDNGTIVVQGLDGSSDRVLYVFEGFGSSWTQSQVITTPEGIINAGFGQDIDLDGNYLAVSARNADSETSNYANNPVLIYELDKGSWEYSTSVFANTDTVNGLGFGRKLEIEGDRLLVASSHVDTTFGALNHGYLYLFTRKNSTWSASDAVFPQPGFGVTSWFFLGQDIALTPNQFFAVETSDQIMEWGPTAPKADTPTMPTACAGEEVTFGLTSEDVTSFAWQLSTNGGTSWTDLSEGGIYNGTSTSSLEVLTSESMAGNELRCVIGNANGNRVTDAVVIAFDSTNCSPEAGSDIFPFPSLADALFGHAVAIQDTVALVGAPGANLDGYHTGGAYFFVQTDSGWTQDTILFDDSVEQAQHFGYSVSLLGNYALIGAPKSTENGKSDAGAAYVFYHNGTSWVKQAKLVSPSPDNNDWFGHAVALQSDDIALVGVPQEDGSSNTNEGAVMVFFRSGDSTWVYSNTITMSSPDTQGLFGWSITTDGSYVAIGSPGYNDEGQVNIYDRQGPIPAFTLMNNVSLPSTPATSQPRFGEALDLDGSNLLVGAPGMGDTGSIAKGEAYVFILAEGEWGWQATLEDTNGDDDDKFGASVAIHGDWLSVGAPGFEDESAHSTIDNHGAVYNYYYSSFSWSFEERIEADTVADDQSYGYSLALDNLDLLIGVPGETVNNKTDAGMVDYYELPSTPSRPAQATFPETAWEFTNFVLYPNPSQGEFTVKWSATESSETIIRLINTMGQEIFTYSAPMSTTETYVNLNSLKSGIYVLSVQQGSKIWTQKLIIE